MTAISKRVCIDKLKETDGKYNKSYHGISKTILADVQLGTYLKYPVEQNDKDSKFKVGNFGKISKWKIFLHRIKRLLEHSMKTVEENQLNKIHDLESNQDKRRWIIGQMEGLW